MGTLFRLGCGLAVVFSAATPGLRAQDITFSNGNPQASLIELYTSEGCSSCPPAEAWLGTLKVAPRLWTEIFPVNFHVDYWDGLGWKDRFADPRFTERQREYAARLGQDSVYTPEFVVDGRENRDWFHGRAPSAAIAKRGTLEVSFERGAVRASYRLVPADSGRALSLNVALLGLQVQSDVGGGENGGRRLEHDFIVLKFDSVPMNAGPGPVAMGRLTLSGSPSPDPAAALVAWVSADDGTILQVAGGALPH